LAYLLKSKSVKESGFVKQNIDKWKAYETELGKQNKDSSAVSKLFIQITDDSAYARTYYHNRSVRVYLNDVAQLLFNDIHKKSQIKFKTLTNFWSIELPVIMYKIRYELLVSFLFFSISVAVGIITSMHQPEFARNVLGDSYVNMTLENIKNNDPMAVYKKQNGTDMFMYITVNNIRVAFVTFVLGLFFGIGTIFSLLRNGLMLGTFQYFFVERGIFRESFLTIWQHGTLEISAIIVAGAAGLTIGRGLIMPGTYTRFQSLRLTAWRGLKVFIGLIPVFMLAAFIEAFFTRYTDAPAIIRLLTILFSLTFVFFYYVVYPYMVVHKHPEKLDVIEKLNSTDDSIPDFSKILNNETLFGTSLKILKKSLSRIFLTIVPIAIGIAVLLSFAEKQIMHEEKFLNTIKNFFVLFNYYRFPLLVIGNTLLIVIVFFQGSLSVRKALKDHKTNDQENVSWKSKIFGLVFMALILQVAFFLPLGAAISIVAFILPFILIIVSIFLSGSISLGQSISESFKLLSSRFGSLIMQYITISVLCSFVVFLFNPNSWITVTPIAALYPFPQFIMEIITFLSWNLNLNELQSEQFTGFIFTFFHYFLASFCLYALYIAMNVLYYTLKEICYADELVAKINLIGSRKTVRGYEID
jgi:uncharacterized membrane protein SpoIIM required for sporulation